MVENINNVTVKIDKTPSVTTISSVSGTLGPFNNGWYISDVTFTLNATDSTSGVLIYCYMLDNNGTWIYCNGTFTISAEGKHTLYYGSYDNALNIEPYHIYLGIIQIDKTPPVTTASLSGTKGLNGWYTSNVNITLASADSVSGISGTYYGINGTSNPVSYTTSFTISTQGVTTVYYGSFDNAGNYYLNSVTVKIDKTPPVTTISSVSGTKRSNGGYAWNATVALTATDNISGVALTQYSINSTGSWTNYTGTPFTITAKGNTTLYYRSIDLANNTGTTSNVKISIDYAPVTTYNLSGTLGSNGWYTSNVTVTLTVSSKYSGTTKTQYKLNSTGSWTNYTGTFTITAQGTTTLYYNSTDSAGNVESMNNVTVKIDRTPPVTKYSLSGTTGSGGYTSNVTVTLTATDNISGVALTQYSINGTSNWITYTGPFIISAKGTTTVYFRSTDNAGNVETAGSVQVTKVN
ncbi:MAG: hypothetical protein WED07_00605 [Candidatus Freyarchaeum deiterrae]